MLGTLKLSIIRLVFWALIITGSNVWAQPIHFSTTSHIALGLTVDTTSLSVDNQKIGLLRSVKLPLVSWYVLFDFYVHKNHQNKGYGKKLFAHVLNKLIANKATKLFLNPGPFEEKDGKFIPVYGPERKELLQKLISFYEGFNFRFVNNKYAAAALKVCYKIVGIHEDPHLLMVYNTKN